MERLLCDLRDWLASPVGGLIWLVLVIHFHQRALAEQEKLDMGHGQG